MKKLSTVILILLIAASYVDCGDSSAAKNKASVIPGMVYIPAGEFRMGSNSGKSDAQPTHKVYLDAFYMDIYEVTNEQYKEFIDSTGHPAPFLDPAKYPWAEKYNWKDGMYPEGTEKYPVVLVSWDDANTYAKWHGKRLPTEAEWERAAKGRKNRLYPWGNEWDPTKCNSRENGLKSAQTVDSYKEGVSEFGLFNMAGNVWEWCSDWYAKDYYKKSLKESPKGPEVGATKVIRGGSWDTYGIHRLRCDARESQFPSTCSYDIGFRCVKDVDK